MNGDQFAGFTNVSPTTMKKMTAASLIATIAALKRALSRTPTTSSDHDEQHDDHGRQVDDRAVRSAPGAARHPRRQVMPKPARRR